jgi:hypothetical protein
MHAGLRSRRELSSYPARAIALELANAPQDKDRRDARSQDEVCGREQHGAAQSLRLRGVLATAGTELFTRSFHLKALLRDRVLPPMDVGEWIFRIDRSNDFIRIRYRLAEADLTLRLRCSTAPGATIAADAWDAFPSDSVLILKAGAPRSDADMHGDAPRYGSPQRPPSSAPIKTPA